MRAIELRGAVARVGAIRAVGLLAFFALAARAAQLTVIEDAGDALWGQQVYTLLELPPARGVLYDRRGVELGVTVNAASVYAMPAEVDDAGRDALARALSVSRARVDERLGRRRGFTFVARWVSSAQAEAVAKLGLPGVGLVAEPKREYPAGALAGRLLGFTNIDGQGARGIEQRENAWLQGSPLSVPVERDGGGQLIAITPVRPTDAAGGDVALTIDASLQAEAELALARAVAETRARGGVAITLDPATGDVLALAEAPSFDPNAFRTTPFRTTGSPAFDRLIEPGSTMKVFVVAAALDAGVVTPDERLDTSGGELDVPGKTIRDRRDFGVLTLADVLRVSSNVGAVQIAYRLGAERHHAALERFGFGRPTGSRFPNEAAGLLRTWRDWQPVDHATISYGQGISVTPVQLAAAIGALANGGVWRTPRLVLARRAPEGDWEYAPLGPSHRAVRGETAAAVLAMMREVVSAEGTGRLAALAGIDVAGKTGTAQKLDPRTHAYSKRDYVAWFAGAVPADDPRLVVVVALDEPRTVHSGGVVAAPLFASVAAAQLAHLGIITHPAPIAAPPPEPVALAHAEAVAPARTAKAAPVSERPRDAAARDAIAATEPPEVSAAPPERRAPLPLPRRAPRAAGELEIARAGSRLFVPDFRGYSLAQVRQITASQGIPLETQGSGLAIEQHPAPGDILDADERHARVFVRFADPRAQAASASTRDGGGL